MIASNYRKFPEAMALQLVLAFGRCCWHTARPTTRQGRAVRAERSRLVADRPQIVRWTKGSIPEWWKAAKHAARELAKAVKQSLRDLVWDQVEVFSPDFDKWMARQKQTHHKTLDEFWETAHLRGCHTYYHGRFDGFAQGFHHQWWHLGMAEPMRAKGYRG